MRRYVDIYNIKMMQMKTTAKAATTETIVSAAQPAQTAPKNEVIKMDAVKHAESLKTRMARLNELSRKTNYLCRMRENMQDLDRFVMKADENTNFVTLKDTDGNVWSTGNSFLLERVVKTLRDEFERKTAELETEILSAEF